MQGQSISLDVAPNVVILRYMPKQHDVFTAGLSLRMSHEDRALFNEAARISGRSVGRTLVICARPMARQIVADETGKYPCECGAQTAQRRSQDADGGLAQDTDETLALDG